MTAQPASLTPETIAALVPAAEAVARLAEAMRQDGTNPVRLLTGRGEAHEFRHYPEGDLYDFASHCQVYYHVHRAGEHGHAHLFLRRRGMPAGLADLGGTGDANAPCHLAAIRFDGQGWPDQVFTTNRWVTGETWYPASQVVRMLPCFRIEGTGPVGRFGHWLTALMMLLRPVVADLLEQRDAVLEAWRRDHPGADALEDQGLEILSQAPLDLDAWIAAIRK